ncbi:hypothetical protein L9F63_006825, partial [Diploptera punctata]
TRINCVLRKYTNFVFTLLTEIHLLRDVHLQTYSPVLETVAVFVNPKKYILKILVYSLVYSSLINKLNSYFHITGSKKKHNLSSIEYIHEQCACKVINSRNKLHKP